MVSIRSKIDIKIGPASSLSASLITFNGLSCEREHIALNIKGRAPGNQRLVRIHSECLTGDVFMSSRCDCGDQLSEAIERMGEVGGTIIYLRQEGRGIGLYPKIDAYKLQDRGHDTFSANELLGFPHDDRDYKVAAEMLELMGLSSVTLLTNNPEKVLDLRRHGISVDRVINTRVFMKQDNLKYLQDKAEIKSHELSF